MTNNPAAARIKDLIDGHDVVLFMKGDRNFPQCGFSAAVVNALRSLGVTYQEVDVLKDDDMRQGIKEFSDWPTIPQLYVRGEFIGGCDIVREMSNNGELAKLFESNGITAA